MRIQLPNGFIDGLDLFNYCNIDELRGKQQNYLADQKLVLNNIGHISKILGDVVLSFETEQGLAWKGDVAKDGIWRLPNGDLETILIRLRENTFGPKFFHEAICSHCSHHHKNLRLDLDKLELDVMTQEELFTKKQITLPKSGKVVELKPPYLRDIYEMLKISTDKQDKLITESVKIAIKSMDQKDPTSKDMEDIPVLDLMYLNDQMEDLKLEGTIDTTIEITCSNPDCGKDFRVKLNPYRPDFFSHTGGSLSLNI